MSLGNKVLVLGGGRSGLAASHALKNLGCEPILIEDTRKYNLENLPDGSALCVISPGISLDDPAVFALREAGVKIISELELGYALARSKIIAVTGTNGKTTTVSIIAHMLKCAGIVTEAAGNIGKPLCAVAPYYPDDAVLSVEVSSFQLETIETFRPDVAVILNITPDHLDRHKTMESYIAAKLRIFENQTKDNIAILNADDPVLKNVKTIAQREYISAKGKVKGAYLAGDILKYHGKHLINRNHLNIKGLHNVYNALAAACACINMGADIEAVRYALRTFKGLPHRLEFVCTDGKIAFINDSKATNPDSCIKGIDGVEGKVYLIMGGSLKDTDFTQVFKSMPERVIKVIVCGAAADKIISDAEAAGYTKFLRAQKFAEAVKRAYLEAKKRGEDCSILLSPGCASFDEFKDYKHRGETFCALAKKLCKYDYMRI